MRWNSQSISAPYVDTFSGSHQSSMLASLLALLLHLEPDLHHLARLDVDLLRLLAERLVPDLDGLLARRHVLDLGRAAGVRDREERGRQDRHPAEHPAVHVAGELDDLGRLELLPHLLVDLEVLDEGRAVIRDRDLDGAPSLGVHRVGALDEQRDARDERRRQDDSECSPHCSDSFSSSARLGSHYWVLRLASRRASPSLRGRRSARTTILREVTRVCSRREPRAASPRT